MAKNQRYTHNTHISVTAPAGGVVSGNPYKIGQYVGVALIDAAAGEKFTLWLDGSWDLSVAGAVAEGGLVYITSSNTLTATASGNYPYGVANAAKGSGTAVLEVAPLGKITNTAALA